MSLDLKRKIIFLAFGTLVIILFYQFALFKDYKLYEKVPGFLLKSLEGHSHYNYDSLSGKVVRFTDEAHHSHDDTSEADDMKEKVRVLCWIMTSPANHQSKAVHVLGTWAKRCNKVLFATESNTNGDGLPLLIINTTEGRDHLTAKTMQTFDYLYKNLLNEYSWFLKADDDTYVIVENMRYFLSSQDPDKPVFFGHHFKPYITQGYFSGGAGYILSREALRRFGERNSNDCQKDQGAEDVEMGFCMQKLGVVTGDSRDALGRSRFHCFNPETHIHGGYPDWYRQYDKYGARQGIESISDYAITFHYVTVEQMYNLEFFIYHLRPYGIISGNQDLNVHNRGVISTHSPTPTSTPTFTHPTSPLVQQALIRKKRRKRRLSTPSSLIEHDTVS